MTRREQTSVHFGYFVSVSLFSLFVSVAAKGIGIHIHISAPHISIPHVQIGPITLTPVGPIPTVAVKPVSNVGNAVIHAGTTVVQGGVNVAANAAQTVTAPAVQAVGVIGGKESLGAAAGRIVKGPGVVVASVGQAVTEINASTNNIPIVAAQSITGNVGQTIMTIVTGPNRLTVDFAATSAIEAGGLLQGNNPEMLIAEPLAAALRSAEYQFEAQSQPIPPDVKAKLACCYPADVLNSARWTVGSVSLSVPDVVNQDRKIFAGVDNAVTVGHITVFAIDPGTNYHWWAHEMQHQVQYGEWGIDQFAFKYVTSCHAVESEAENKAQQVVPVPIPTQLMC